MDYVLLILAIFMVLSSPVLRISNATHDFVGHIGGIVDFSTRMGREENISMEMAVGDFHNSPGYELDLNIGNLSGISDRAAFAGFISIDCGTSANTSYTDAATGLDFILDTAYIDTGVSKSIASEYKTNSLEKQFNYVRSFPQGLRNCYALKPPQVKVFDSIKTQQVRAIVGIPLNGSYEMAVMPHSTGCKTPLSNFEATTICKVSRQSRRRGRAYVESGLVMVVPLKTYKSEGPWVFLKPFTKGMWFSMVAISLLTGFVVWVLEHSSNEDFRGPWMQQFGNILWFSFTTLYLGRHRDSLSNLSRFVMAPWLFLILIVSATFVASLTSMMTTSRLEPSEIDVISLKKTNAAVGYDGSILTTTYLKMVLGFKPVNIKSFVSLDDHAQALRNGVIKAGFFSIERAIVFLAENCKDFTMVFQKDSPLASDISEAIQRLKQSGSGGLQHLEKAMVSYLKCFTSALQTDSNADKSIGVAPFAGLLGLSISASAIALSIMVARFLRKRLRGIQLTFTSQDFWKLVAALVLARENTSSALVSHTFRS